MKKQYLIAFFMLFGTLNSFIYSQTGFTCSTPIPINSLPYQTTDNTANYGDTADVAQGTLCGALPSTTNYMSGNDVFYAYTPTISGTINVKMTPSQGLSSIFIYEGCNNIGVSCLAGVANSSSAPREIPSLNVIAGQTYTIVISAFASPSIGYTLLIQNVGCSTITNLGVNNLTTNSVNLTWTANIGVSSWEYLVQPLGLGTPIGPGFSTNSSSTNPITDLTPNTAYQYWVRSNCGNGNFSSWFGPLIFNTPICSTANQCNYKFTLTDTGQNGWNGGRMQVKQSGTTIATLGESLLGGGPFIINVPLCNNVPFDLYWSEAGTAPNEMGIIVENPYSDIIYSKPAGTGNPFEVLCTSTVNCTPPTCPKPIELTSNITATTAQLSWTATEGSATQWEVYVVPIGSALPVNGTPISGLAPYHIVNTNPCTITGLEPSTSYKFFVRSICSVNDVGTWTIINPGEFTTKPINDDCNYAIPIAVNQTRDCILSTTGSTLGATDSFSSVNVSCALGGNIFFSDVWYSFVATNSTHIITLNNISGNATNSVFHTIYSGNDCSTQTKLYCTNSKVSVAQNLIPGNTYKINVHENYLEEYGFAIFNICVSTPPPIINDECASAIPAIVNSGQICNAVTAGYVVGATASTITNTCLGNANNDIWFSFVSNSTTQYLSFINIVGEYTSLYHSVYSGNCNTLELKYCGQASSSNDTFVIGQTYYIRVWANASSSIQEITFDLCIGKNPPPIATSTTAYTTEQLVSNLLINNPCINISNVTSSTGTNFSSVNGIGSFNSILIDFPIESGLVLSSGNVLNIPGPNTSVLNEGSTTWPGDSQLESIISTATGQPMNSKNASTLEFDFTSVNEFMSFNFVFASEEYGTYQCTYADAFAFLLTDLTTNVTTNLAVVPGTGNPVSVVTIRDQVFNQSCPSVNSAYFDTYYGAPFPQGVNPIGAPINFNGISNLMTASSPILPNHPYHIKLVVADRGDTAFDTAVFIQGGSFTSGPPECMDKIKLVAFVDENANGIKDTNEGNFIYGSSVLQQNNMGTPTNISSPTGNYTLYDANPINTYDFIFQINPEYSPYFSATATNFNDINIPVGSGTQTLYFPITVTQGYNDVLVTIVPVGQPRPGYTCTHKIVYKNSGIATTSGTVTFTKPALTTITNIGQTGTISTATGFTYDFSNLAPYETRTILVNLSIPNMPTVNIDDILTSSATISAPANDINLANNAFTNNQIVVASYDPNDKMEAHGEKILFSSFGANEYLTYTIRFQNTGTANAIQVRLEDLLDAQLDAQSIRMVSASHNYIMERVNNKIVWKFDYINLVGAMQNEELSKGYVTFQIKLLPGFEVGDIIPNHADIYFDTNPAITTNTFNTEFVAALKTVTFNAENIMIYPNPSSNVINIRLENTMENLESVVLYDVVGKSVLKTINIDSNQSTIDVSALAKGMYMVEITTVNQLKMTKKLVVK